MADAADSTRTSSGQFALTIDDLNTTVNHEPRVSHKRLALALGYADDTKLLQLAERHREALERFGVISATVAENTGKRGRPGKTLWLNKRQVLYLCAKSEMENATETTIAMVEVFDAHLAGTLAAPVAVKGHRRALPRPRGPRAPAAPAGFAPHLDHDGFAVMRLAGETLVVDLMRVEPGRDGRAVAIGWGTGIAVEDLAAAKANAKFLGDRSVTLPDPGAKTGRRSVWVVGGVVASQPVAAPGHDRPASRGRKRAAPGHDLGGIRRGPAADLFAAPAAGTA